MKILFFALAVCVLGAVTALGDLTIVQTIEGMGQKTESTSLFKSGKTRVNTSPGASLIMDLKTGEMINLLHPQKSYLKVSGEMARAAIESMKQTQGSHPDAKPQLTATGNRETISGFAVEEYTGTVAGMKMSLWLTKSLPDYPSVLKDLAAFNDGPMATVMQNYGVDVAHLPGFPIRTTLEIQPGQTLTRTVVSVGTAPIADAEFEIPADYKEIAAPVLTPPAAVQGTPAK